MSITLPKRHRVLADYSTQNGQLVTKRRLEVHITPSQNGPARAGESDAR